jgi:hypothetical protein
VSVRHGNSCLAREGCGAGTGRDKLGSRTALAAAQRARRWGWGPVRSDPFTQGPCPAGTLGQPTVAVKPRVITLLPCRDLAHENRKVHSVIEPRPHISRLFGLKGNSLPYSLQVRSIGHSKPVTPASKMALPSHDRPGATDSPGAEKFFNF